MISGMSDTLAGPGILFFQGLTIVLVLGALGVIVDALRRPATRWRHAFVRWLWTLVPLVFIVALVVALIWRTSATLTVVGIVTVFTIIAEVAYLLRVVFPAPGRISRTAPSVEPTPEASEPVPRPAAPDPAEKRGPSHA